MAQANLRSTGKALRVLGLFCLLLLVQKGIAFEFKVGGPNGWAVPADPNSNSHNQWAEKNRFQTGDSLLFVYPGDKDSVLYVTKEDYNNCSTDRPLQKFTDGHTVFNLNHSGPYYFISGVKDNCLKNEKIIVVVMANRSKLAPAPSNETVAASLLQMKRRHLLLLHHQQRYPHPQHQQLENHLLHPLDQRRQIQLQPLQSNHLLIKVVHLQFFSDSLAPWELFLDHHSCCFSEFKICVVKSLGYIFFFNF
nr:early nodulin-like protein 1 [Coffea arabica]